MSRQARTAIVLGFELLLLLAMAGSFAYFVLASRNFLTNPAIHRVTTEPAGQASSTT